MIPDSITSDRIRTLAKRFDPELARGLADGMVSGDDLALARAILRDNPSSLAAQELFEAVDFKHSRQSRETQRYADADGRAPASSWRDDDCDDRGVARDYRPAAEERRERRNVEAGLSRLREELSRSRVSRSDLRLARDVVRDAERSGYRVNTARRLEEEVAQRLRQQNRDERREQYEPPVRYARYEGRDHRQRDYRRYEYRGPAGRDWPERVARDITAYAARRVVRGVTDRLLDRVDRAIWG